MNPTALTRFTVSVFAAGVIGFGFVLGTLMKPSTGAAAYAESTIPLLSYAEIRELEPGEAMEVSGFYGRVVIYRPTPSDFATLNLLNDHVWDPSLNTWSEALGVFIHNGTSPRLGCNLQLVPESESTADRQWLGGYVCESHAYDLAGRSISSEQYSWNGLVTKVANLAAPRVVFEEDGIVLLAFTASASQQISQNALLP